MTFKVGDVCEWVYSICGNPLCDTVVIEVKEFLSRQGHPCSYLCRDPDGSIYGASKDQIRLKRPPNYPEQFSAGDWGLCPWQPGKVKQAEPADRWEKWRTRERT